MATPLEYENLDVLNGLIDELKLMLKKEQTLQNAVNNSVGELNDYYIVDSIKDILNQKQTLELTLDEQKSIDTLLLPENVFQLMKLNYPSIFQEIGIFEENEAEFTVEKQNKVLKKLLQKVTEDNSLLINYLQTDQTNGTLAVVGKFKLLINTQLENTVQKLTNMYKQELFPLEDQKMAYADITGTNSLTKLKAFYLILQSIELELSKCNI